MEGKAKINVRQLGVDGCQLIAAVTLAGGALHVESLESLADDLGSTRKKLRTALAKLVAAGVIEVSSKRNAGTEIRLANLQPREEKPTKPKREKQVKPTPQAEEVKREEERPAEYWDKLSEKFAPVLFDPSATWDNALKRKWLRLVDDHGEEVADRLVAAVGSADWIRDRGNLNLILLIANADKILAGRYGKVFESRPKPESNIKRSKAALCVGGDSSKNDFLKLFKT